MGAPRLPLLDLGNAWAVPWQGSGSMMAIQAHADGSDWRVKSSGDSGCSAVEVTLGKLFRMTGLAAPDMRLATPVGCLPGDASNIASRLDNAFQDLGSFLRTDQAQALASAGDDSRRADYLRLRSAHTLAEAGCAQVLADGGVRHFWELQRPDQVHAHADFDRQRFQALEGMNRMLPDHLRDEQVRHYLASQWLGNWDHLNYRMENFGYTERDGALVGMTVDFASCGPLGFRSPVTGELLHKQDSGTLALAQRPATLFAIPEAWAANAAGFDTGGAASAAFTDTLHWPYGFQSETVAERLRPPVAADAALADTLAEMGYRLMLLPAPAIAELIESAWEMPGGPGDWPDAASMAADVLQRRDALVAGFDREQVIAWIAADPLRADRVRQEIVAGMRSAFETEARAAAHVQLLEQSHAALLEPVAHVINGVTREVQLLQALRACAQDLLRALARGDAAGVDTAFEALLSEPVYGQLVVSMALGPGTTPGREAAFAANHHWLALVRGLAAQDADRAERLLDRLTTPTASGDHHPATLAACSGAQPALAREFVDLLQTIARSGVSPEALRTRLLTAKVAGQPNFYTAIMREPGALPLVQGLRDADLIPQPAELRQARSLPSALRLEYQFTRAAQAAVAGTAAPTSPGARATPLHMIAADVSCSYTPVVIANLETPLLREAVLSTLTLVTDQERQQADTLALKAIEAEWQLQQSSHPGMLPRHAPQALIRDVQIDAQDRLVRALSDQRRAEANALIAQHQQAYVEAVRDAPTINAAARQAVLQDYTESTKEAIRAWVGRQDSKPVATVQAASLPAAGLNQRVQEGARSAAAAATTAAVAHSAAQAASRTAGTRAAAAAASRAADRHAADAVNDAVRAAGLQRFANSQQREMERRDGEARDRGLQARWLGSRAHSRMERVGDAQAALAAAAPSPPVTPLRSGATASRTAVALDRQGRPHARPR